MISKPCTKCKEVKPLEAYNKAKIVKDGRRSSCRACDNLYKQKYREDNREQINIKNRAYIAANREKTRETNRKSWELHAIKRRMEKQVYRAKNISLVKSNARKYRRNNLASDAAKSAKRRAAKKLRTPSWVDYPKIKRFYVEAQKLGLQVDHVVPLQGEKVCGLHVHDNLQLLTKSENSAKNNHFLT